jgi:WD40 repeat protein
LVPTAPWHLGGIETGYGLFGVAVLSSTFVVLWRLGHHKTACGLLALSIIIPALFLSFLLLHSFKLDHTLTGHLDLVNSVAFSPDGKSLASGSSDGTIKLWDVAHGTLSQTLTGHSGSVFSVAFSPDGKSLASGCSDGIELWGLATGTLTQRLTGHLENVGLPALSVAFSPDGQLLAAGEFGGVELVDVATGTVRRTLPVPSATLPTGR